jgi:hypothetical protein
MKEDRGASDFFVEIVNTDPYIFYNGDISGFVTNFGENVQFMKSKEFSLSYSESGDVQTLTATVSKKYTHTLDISTLTFTCVFSRIEKWGRSGKGLITFPSYY